MERSDMYDIADSLIYILGLSAYPVGVRFIPNGAEPAEDAEILNGRTYCQAIMQAREGKSVLISADSISCPSAAFAFGFRPLPERLDSDRGLAGYGIASDRSVLESMPRLKPGSIAFVHLYPLEYSDSLPDVTIIEDEPEKLMWVVLAYAHATGTECVQASTSVLQGSCVDSTIVPYLEDRLNYSLGCFAGREATDIGVDEAVIGFPGRLLPAITKHLCDLGARAIPRSRSKGAYRILEHQ